MIEFLLEIYGEEIPYSSQILIEKQLKLLFENLLDKIGIKYKGIQTFSTSRRATIIINNLQEYTNVKFKEFRGPKVGADDKALQGFLRSKNLKNINSLDTKIINKNTYYIYKEKLNRENVAKILEINIPIILDSIKWKKSMRWGVNKERWIRPIKNIMAIFGKKVIKFEFAGIKSNNITYGNYQFTSEKFKCSNFKEYKKIMLKNKVILEKEKREEKILKEINKFCIKENLLFQENNDLLNRVAGSVEFPNVFFGTFDKEYFKLPDFLLENILSHIQNYFSFKQKDNRLSNTFCFVSNLPKEKKNNLVKGNQNVLKARFNDADFFINEDLKKRLDERMLYLERIVFYKNVGTLFQRAKRIQLLVGKILEKNNKNHKDVNHLNLSNADLTTDLVKEFPNLQGKVGGYYAKKENLPPELCLAISDQYEYEFGSSYSNYLTYILSISQKFDSLFGYFVSYHKLSGAGDPFGIRRSALSIIKICIDKEIDINFSELFIFIRSLYEEQNIKVNIEFKLIEEFFKKRIEVLFSELKFSSNIISASLKKSSMNPYLISKKIKSLSKFISSKIGRDFLMAFKRLDSMIETYLDENIEVKLLTMNEEKALHRLIIEFDKNELPRRNIISNADFIIKITVSLNKFFDSVIVNDKDFKIKNNRKVLISNFHKELNKEFHFSLLVK